MFCKYCGKKIEKSELPCPYCGKEQGMLCSTDGYFGILGSAMPDGGKERMMKEAHIEDGYEKKGATKIEEIKRESEPEKPAEVSTKSRIIDIFMNREIWKKFADRKCLRIIAIVALLALFIACNVYQNYSIGVLQKRVSDLEKQVEVYQEVVRNGDEEKVNSQNE